MNRTAAIEFKLFAQTELPDSKLFNADILLAMNGVRRSLIEAQDKLFVLENLLEEANDREATAARGR
jgi:hypothetical protein